MIPAPCAEGTAGVDALGAGMRVAVAGCEMAVPVAGGTVGALPDIAVIGGGLGAGMRVAVAVGTLGVAVAVADLGVDVAVGGALVGVTVGMNTVNGVVRSGDLGAGLNAK